MLNDTLADAFVERFVVEPEADGPLRGTAFAVKDLFDVAGRPTGIGNPTWRATHSLPQTNAGVVQRLLGAGARLVGKTRTDELAYSLDGRNFHEGAPLNPAAPERLTGGSSSGAASAASRPDARQTRSAPRTGAGSTSRRARGDADSASSDAPATRHKDGTAEAAGGGGPFTPESLAEP